MNTFQQALAERAAKLNKKLNGSSSPDTSEPQVIIKLVMKLRPEIQVSFTGYPGPQVIADLKAAGFRWNPDNKYWWAPDNQQKRDFCNTRFKGANLEPFDTSDQAQTLPDPAVAPALPDNSPFGVYKRQVDELLDHLHISAADLQLLAIDKLHKATFGRN